MKQDLWWKRVLAFAAVPVVVASMAVATSTPAQAATPTYVRPGCASTTSAADKDGVPLAHCFAVGVANSSGKLAVRATAAGAPATAITPDQLKAAYSLPDAGAGMTVAIVDAFGYANAEADLAVWRSYYGLTPCTTANGCFKKTDQRGGADYPDEDGGWSIETALDLDAVSAVCPKCNLLLVQGDTNGFDDLGQAVDTAAQLGANAISNSYGVDGEFDTANQYDQYYDHPGIAVTVSSGDTGNAQSWPATNPNVTGVGGTLLTPDNSARGFTETAWDDAGSGCSLYEPKPDYQVGLTTDCDNKASADISADASPASGLAVYNTLGQSGWSQYGGTSLSSPLVAGMFALAGTPVPGTYPVSYPYRNPAGLNDVTSGTNGSCGNLLCQAGPGYDGPTGLGTPNGIAALTLGDTGEITGKVTDSATGAGVGGAVVSATRSNGDKFTATAGADGSYDLHALADSYDLKVTKFGYADATASGVAVTTGTAVHKDFALTAKPSKVLSGKVTDGSGHGYPMRAKITIDGYPDGAIYSDAFTGDYSVKLPAGSDYTLHVSSADLPGYTDQAATVSLNDDTTENIGLKVDASTCTAPGYAYQESGTQEAFTGWTGTTPKDGWTITDAVGNGQSWTFGTPQSPYNWPPNTDGDMASIDSGAYGEGGQQDAALVSPVIDMSGHADPEIGFDTAYIGFPDQTGQVDLSLDGGDTWSTVYQPYGTIAHVDVPIPQAAGQSKVRVRFHFTGSWSRSWKVDDVLLGSRWCAPQTGGLVAGTVSDANTGDPLNGATVTSDVTATDFGVSAATPEDPGVGDGYYWLFSSHTGTTAFTTSDGRYTIAHSSVTVAANAVTKANVSLDAGRLTVDTHDLAVTEVLGALKSQTVTFGNTGKKAVQVHLSQSDGGSTPAAQAGTGAPLMLIKTKASPNGLLGAGSAERQASPASAPWTDVADYPTAIDDNVVANHAGKIYSVGGNDGSYRTNAANVYDPAANAWSAIAPLPQRADQSVGGFVEDKLYVAGGWDDLSNPSPHAYSYDPATGKWTAIADLPVGLASAAGAVVAGKLYVVGGCTTQACSTPSSKVYSYDPDANSWTEEPAYPTGVRLQACGGVGSSLICAGGLNGTGSAKTYSYLPGSGAWVPKADLPTDDWGAAATVANGRLQVLGGIVNGSADLTNQVWEYDPNIDAWSSLANSNNASYRGGAACGIYKVGGADQSGANSFVESLPGYGACGGDVSWMSENKTDFSVAPGKTVTVRVTADSSAVAQPGTYVGQVVISTDSPYPSTAPVTMTMTVTAPATWGKILGTVTDKSGNPLAGATVAVCTMFESGTGTCGPTTFTLKTDADGVYQLWLNKGYNPLEVIAAKDGYTPALKIVKIIKGDTVETDFALAGNSSFTSAKVRAYLNDTIQSK
jgi:N-acetylneuraminic acid mutarotase